MTSLLTLLWSRLRSIVTRNRLDREFDEELTTHLELLTDEFRRRGLSATEARREALLKLGRPDRLREAHREHRSLPVVDVISQDLRYALPQAVEEPGVHRRRHALACARHRRQHRALQPRRQPAAALAAGARAGSPGADPGLSRPDRWLQETVSHVRAVGVRSGARSGPDCLRGCRLLASRPSDDGGRRRRGASPRGGAGLGELLPRSWRDAAHRPNTGNVG